MIALVVLCSQVFGAGPVNLVLPAPDATDVPIDAQIVVQATDCCLDPDPDPVPLDQLLHLRRRGDPSDVAATFDLSTKWNTGSVDDYLTTTTVRITPSMSLDPATTFDVHLIRSSGDEIVGSFTTGDAASASAAPATPEISIDAAPATDCAPGVSCCEPITLQQLTATGDDPSLVYDVTTSVGAPIAIGIRASELGYAVCGGRDPGLPYVESDTRGLVPVIFDHTSDDVTLNVVARDVAGRSSPPEQVDFVADCAPPPAGCCSTGGDGRGSLALAALVLVLSPLRRRARRARAE